MREIWYNDALNKTSNQMVSFILHKNYSSNKHRHQFYEINVVLHGTGVHTINGKDYNCSQGDLFIIPPFISHQYISHGNLDVYNIMIGDLWMRTYAGVCDTLPGFYSLFSPNLLIGEDGEYFQSLRLKSKEFKILESTLSTSNLLITNTKPQDEDPMISSFNTCMSSYSLSIVSFICFCYSLYGKNLFLMSDADETNTFAKSLHYIYTHYNEKITIDELVKHAAMSYSTYNRIFKENFNCSPLNYINQYRVSVAKYYLKKGTSVSEAASMTGFCDHSHFIKTFSKVTGMTPTEYKNAK